jgi:hypothetical protein
MRLCWSCVQLSRPTSPSCAGAATVSTSLARHCRGQRLSVRQSLMVVQACRQLAPPTTHVRCSSTSYRSSYPSTLTSVSCRSCLTRSWSMWICRAVVDAVPPAVDGPSRQQRPRCDSLPRPRSMRLGVLLSVMVLMVQPQGEMKRTTVRRWQEVQAERRRALQFLTAKSTSVMCPSVDPLLTVVAHTTQSTEYAHVCVVVDQVVHPCLGHEGASVGGDDDCRGGGGTFSSATVMFCRYAESTVNVTRSDGQCCGTEATGEEWDHAEDVWTLA